jgi:hypothetical protein
MSYKKLVAISFVCLCACGGENAENNGSTSNDAGDTADVSLPTDAEQTVDGGLPDGPDTGSDSGVESDSGVPSGELKAFPSAEGFGKDSVGGRGGQVIYVTNTDDSGPGSLREAVEASGPRTVVFRVGGRIDLTSTIRITNPFITIAGQTAPGDGITLTAEGTPNIPLLQVETNDVVIRYLRFRRSSVDVSETNSDCLTIKDPSNRVMVDHISTSQGSDEVLSIYDYSGGGDAGVQNVTIQNSIIGRAYGGNSKGALCSGVLDRLSFFRNVWVSNGQRNPLLKFDEGEGVEADTYYEIVNNVIYDARFKTNFSNNDSQSGLRHLNYVNNHYFENEGGGDARRMLMIETSYPVAVFARGNVSPTRTSISDPVDWDEEWNITQGTDDNGGSTDLDAADAYDLADTSYQSTTPFSTPILDDEVPLFDAVDVFDNIKDDVGCSLPVRDAYDAARISDVENRQQTFGATGEAIADYASGTPYTDSDSDGMSDDWESANGHDNGVDDGALDSDGDGYTNLEEFLNSLAQQ